MTQALAGQLTFYPGRPLPSITSSRAALAATLLRGKPATQAARLLPCLYTLCGEAHRITAQLAIDAARGHGGRADRADSTDSGGRAMLEAETAREHARRIWLDWPRLLGGAADVTATPAPALRDLAACPWLRPAPSIDVAALRGWAESALLGEPPDGWLDGWRRDPAGWLGAWAARGATLPARLLRAVECEARQLRGGAAPLLPHRERAALLELAHTIATDSAAAGGAFERAPVCGGQVRETGSWTRLAQHDAGQDAAPSAWWRLGARIAELAGLSAPRGDAAPPLALGALALAPGQALAWSEMARGLLLHWVRLESDAPDALIADYRVLAPTEWNFHPRGAVAQALAAMAPDACPVTQRRVGILAAAYDPCVTFTIEFEHA